MSIQRNIKRSFIAFLVAVTLAAGQAAPAAAHNYYDCPPPDKKAVEIGAAVGGAIALVTIVAALLNNSSANAPAPPLQVYSDSSAPSQGLQADYSYPEP